MRIKVIMRGVTSNTSTGTTWIFAVNLGGVQICANPAVNTTAQVATNQGWVFEADLVCIAATGSTATWIGNGMYQAWNCWQGTVTTAAANVNTAADAAIDVTLTCGNNNASNAHTCNFASIEVIYPQT
jgi:hypothetical protein